MRDWINLVEAKMKPRWLYHGTYRDNIASIMRIGLDPSRSLSGMDAVFLAADINTAKNYDGHHMAHSVEREWVVLKIEVAKLDENKLGPDHYELPDMLEYLDEDDPCFGAEWDELSWQDSLRVCGQCAYEGVIPVVAISEVDNNYA